MRAASLHAYAQFFCMTWLRFQPKTDVLLALPVVTPRSISRLMLSLSSSLTSTSNSSLALFTRLTHVHQAMQLDKDLNYIPTFKNNLKSIALLFVSIPYHTYSPTPHPPLPPGTCFLLVSRSPHVVLADFVP